MANDLLDVMAGPSGEAHPAAYATYIVASARLHLHLLAAARPETNANPAEANPDKDNSAKTKPTP